jgi:hypothetical protein
VNASTPELQGELKNNFETALGELREKAPKLAARRLPIVQRNQRVGRTSDPKTQAISVAATALATLWGL